MSQAGREPELESRLCSAISRAAGDDPGGSAPAFERCLMVEVGVPYQRDVAQSRSFPEGLLPVLREAEERGGLQKFGAFMPDAGYSRAGHTRLFLFSRADSRAGEAASVGSEYWKTELLVPDSEVSGAAEAVLSEGGLGRYEEYRQPTQGVREIFICTHGRRDTCCGKFGYPVYRKLADDYAGEELRVWRSSHLGGHRFAPTLMDLPSGRSWGHLDEEDLAYVILRAGEFGTVQKNYRGYSGLSSRHEQLAEREVLVREGWEWAEYIRRGELLEFSADGTATGPVAGPAAEVELEYALPGGERVLYRATLEKTGSVMTLASSGTDPLEEVEQYTVSRLRRS